MNRNVTPRGISLSVVQTSVPIFMSGTLVCLRSSQEGDVISGLFHQGIEHRLSEENVAASCTCLSSRAACFVSPWSQAVARWYWERTGLLRVTAEHRLCEMAQWEKILKNPKQQQQQQNLIQRKRQKKAKQLSTVFLIKTSSAVVAIAKYNNRTRILEFRNIRCFVRDGWTNYFWALDRDQTGFIISTFSFILRLLKIRWFCENPFQALFFLLLASQCNL